VKRIISILLLCAFAIALPPAVLTGCKSTPNQIAYQSADAVISSVDLAVRGWADHVVSERKRIKAMPAMERGTAESDLLRKEGKVIDALSRYHVAMGAAEVAVGVAFTQGKPLPETVSAAASALLAILKEVK
jgi:hypothetical protein